MRILAFYLALLTASASAQTLLVVNQGDSTMSLVDPHTGRQVAAVAEGTPGVHAHEVTASADGRTAFLPVYGSTGVGKPGIDGHEMLVVDLPLHKIVGHVDFGHGVRPHDPVLDPNTGLLYVTTELDKTVSIIDPHTLKIVGAVPTGQEQSHMLAISHDGRLGYTANVGPGTVSVLDLQGRRTLAIIPVSKDVQRIALSSDDKLLFTADQTKPQLAVIDTGTRTLKSWIALPGLGYGAGATLDGRWLLVAVPSVNQVAVVDLKTLTVVRSLDVAKSPQEVLIAPGGKLAYVSCNLGAAVAAIDLTQMKVQQIIPAGHLADGLGWAN
jgi:DNA-binding beta-propeller fold protein YncE